jgi:hypothetical protein
MAATGSEVGEVRLDAERLVRKSCNSLVEKTTV